MSFYDWIWKLKILGEISMIKRIIKKLLNKKTQLDYLIENGLKIGR